MDKKGNLKFDVLLRSIPSVYKELVNEMIDTCSDIGKFSFATRIRVLFNWLDFH